ncbi:MAG: single-stranded DNA-binding protein [Micromonosporaceae bacterium]
MAGEPTTVITGNLTADPELRFTQNGVAVVKFSVAQTPRRYDKTTESYTDGDTLFMRCTAWRQAAENIAETLTKGTRVVVTGRLQQNSWETSDGNTRTSIDLEVDEVGPSLRWATAKVNRLERKNAATNTSTTGGHSDSDAFATTSPGDNDDAPPF